MGFVSEFRAFLVEYKVMALAIAFIMGLAIINAVQSLVNDIIMPIITPFIPGGAWKDATVTAGLIVMKVGSFFGAIINFIIIALVVFLIAKWFFKEKVVTKK